MHKSAALGLVLLVLCAAAAADENSLRQQDSTTYTPSWISRVSSAVQDVVDKITAFVLPPPGHAYVEEGPALEHAGKVPAHFKHIAKLVRAVMQKHANTPAKRVALIKKSLKTLRIDTLTDGQINHFFPGLKDDFSFDDYLIKIAGCGAANPFLDRFVKRVAYGQWYAHKTDIGTVIPEAFGYMVTLDRLTDASRRHFHSLTLLKTTIKKAGDNVPWKDFTNNFEQAKKMTIDGVVDEYIKMHKEKEVPDDWGRRTLPLNVCEAALEDYRLGFDMNAEAGVGIAFERPGASEYDPRTEAGPSNFTPDGQGIEYNLPLPKIYADSYSTWNMAFVSHYGDAPHFWAKLVNPTVFCYEEEPNVYLYKRVIALYLHIAAQMFDRADRKSDTAAYKWNDDRLTKIWAEENYDSIYGPDGYLDQIYQATGEDQSWAKTKAQDIMYHFGQFHAEDIADLMRIGMELKGADSWSLSDYFAIVKHGSRAVYLLIHALIWS